MIKYKYITVFIVVMSLAAVLFAYGYGEGPSELDSMFNNVNNIDDIVVENNIDEKKFQNDEVYTYYVKDHVIDMAESDLDKYLSENFDLLDKIDVINAPKIEMGNGWFSQVEGDEKQIDGIYVRALTDGEISLYLASYLEKKLMYGGTKMTEYDNEIANCREIVNKWFDDISKEYKVDEFPDLKISTSDKKVYYYYDVHFNRNIDGIPTNSVAIKNGEKTDGERIDVYFNEKYIFGFEIKNYCNIERDEKVIIGDDIVKKAIDNLKMWIYANDSKEVYLKYYIKDANLRYVLREKSDGSEYYDPVIELNVDIEERYSSMSSVYTYSIKDGEILDYMKIN